MRSKGGQRDGEGNTTKFSKHSRVCHDRISVNPLFIGVFVTSVCIFGILHLAVFSQFGNLALPLQFYMETYRSGHNGADSKSVREQSPASSNLAVSAKDSLKVLSFKEFSLLSQGSSYRHRTCFLAFAINVAVNVCRCSHIAVAKPVLNHFHRHTVCK